MDAKAVQKALRDIGSRSAVKRAAPVLDDDTLRRLGLAIEQASEKTEDEDETEEGD